VAGAVLALGFATQKIVELVAPSWSGGPVVEGGRLTGFIEQWVLIPEGHGRFGGLAYVALVVAILLVTRLPRSMRIYALVPCVYLATVVWENTFVQQPAVARWILFGSLLIVLMTFRPQGLLGTQRVEVV
jgi:ABC-type branched-subunit amino acid transport system permease subunit